MKHTTLLLLVVATMMAILPRGVRAQGGLTTAGAEADADDCCDKCAEGEACATTPTGCDCWVPDTDDVAGGGDAGGSKLSGGAGRAPVMTLGDAKLGAGVAVLGKGGDKLDAKLKPTKGKEKAPWDSRTKRVKSGRVGRLAQRGSFDLFGSGPDADTKERMPARTFAGLTRVGSGNVVTASRSDTEGFVVAEDDEEPLSAAEALGDFISTVDTTAVLTSAQKARCRARTDAATGKPLEMGHKDYCTRECPCGEGEGDCDDTQHSRDCQKGLVCQANVGDDWGMPAHFDVCLRPDGYDNGAEADAGLFEGDIDITGDIGIVERQFGTASAAKVLAAVPQAAPKFAHAGFVNTYDVSAKLREATVGVMTGKDPKDLGVGGKDLSGAGVVVEREPGKLKAFETEHGATDAAAADVSPTKAVALRGNTVAGGGKRSLGAHNDAKRLWPLVVPYYISPSFSTTRKNMIKDAIKLWEDNTCIDFRPTKSSDDDWLHFKVGSGCSSPVGRQGGGNTIKLAAGCGKISTAHEIAHSLGFWHEQSRKDRNSHVQIKWANIASGKSHNFNKQTKVNSLGSPYDYSSIMHYGRRAFSKNGKDTIKTLDPSMQNVIGNRVALSAEDIAQMNELYTCDKTCPAGYDMTYKWYGTAPFCNGKCPAGWTEVSRDKSGDGNRCWTGSKAYCKRCCKKVKVYQYKWFGTAPFCNGKCPSGWTFLKSSKRGDGAKCWTGRKHYCYRKTTKNSCTSAI